LAPFAAKARQAGLQDRVELISHFGLDHPAHHGRDYGEFKLVDQAMQHSALIAAQGAPPWRVLKDAASSSTIGLKRASTIAETRRVLSVDACPPLRGRLRVPVG